MLSVAAVEGGPVRKGQHLAEAWWRMGSTLNSQLLVLPQHREVDAGIVRAIDPKFLVDN